MFHIDDANGNHLADAPEMTLDQARDLAQRFADRRGETVGLYDDTGASEAVDPTPSGEVDIALTDYQASTVTDGGVDAHLRLVFRSTGMALEGEVTFTRAAPRSNLWIGQGPLETWLSIDACLSHGVVARIAAGSDDAACNRAIARLEAELEADENDGDAMCNAGSSADYDAG
jgi:hypothetical protein